MTDQRRVSRTQASLLILLAVLLALFWLVPAVPLLGFAAVLLAIALRTPAAWVARQTGVRRWVAVLGLAASVVALVVLAGWFAARPLAAQANQLMEELPRAIEALRQRLPQSGIGAWVASRLQSASAPGDGSSALSSVAAAASGTLGALGDTVVVLLMGLYLATQPHLYMRGLRALAAPELDEKMRETLDECGQTLRGWLLGQAFAMLFTGTVVWLGLMLLGVPLAGVLGAIVALLNFIPYLGPVIAAIPAMLLALTQSATLPLWVAALFLVTQSIEGNILTPLVQSRTADLPPALLLLAQLLMGGLFGLLGVALAAPMVAVAMVLVRRGYVEGWLGRSVPEEARAER